MDQNELGKTCIIWHIEDQAKEVIVWVIYGGVYERNQDGGKRIWSPKINLNHYKFRKV